MLLLLQVCVLLSHPPPKQDGCWCARLKPTLGGWCQQCSVGYIAGVKLESASFVEAMDTHGHECDIETLKCDSCRKAAERNGRCERCRHYFVGNKIYASELTYYLALGEIDLGPPDCKACSTKSSPTAWCKQCKSGWVAHFRYRDKAIWEGAAEQYMLLLSVVLVEQSCKDCAYAYYGGTKCIGCGVNHQGRRSLFPPPGASQSNRP